MNLKCVLLGFLIICVNGIQTKRTYSIPSYVSLCHRNDHNINKCIKNVANDLIPKLGKGIPEMALPQLEPIIIPEITLKENSLVAIFKDVTIDYLSKSTIKDCKVDLDKNEIFIHIHSPLLRIRSQYNIDGKLLILQLKGKGSGDGNYTNIDCGLQLRGRREKKQEKEYFKFDGVHLNLSIENAHLDFGNIFPDEELSKTTNRILNENAIGIVNEMKPIIQTAIEEFIRKICKTFFDAFSIDELFPL